MASRPTMMSEPISYILPEDEKEPVEKQTKWKIKALSNKALEEIRASIELTQKPSGDLGVVGTQSSDGIAFKRGCVGFDQYFIGDEKIEFSGEETPQADGYKRCNAVELEKIHLAHQVAVGKKILEISALSKESKNS